MKFKLYNFDHQLRYPMSFGAGPFVIAVEQSHCDNLSKLSKLASTHYDYDSRQGRTVTQREAQRGECVETAIVESSHTLGNSILFSESPGADELYDLIMLLSFLTGRRVYREDELGDYPNLLSSFRITENDIFFGNQLKTAWTNLQKLKTTNLSAALYNIVLTYGTTDPITKGAHANAALDVMTTSWCSNNKATKYKTSGVLGNAREATINWLTDRLTTRADLYFIRLLAQQSIDEKIIEDIRSRLNGAIQPSAMFKLKTFLRGVGLYPAVETSEAESRLRWLNWVRNAVAHYGDLPDKNGLGFEERLQITGAINFVVVEIAQIYITKYILNIRSSSVARAEKNILDFFVSGTYNGQPVFSGNYQEYMRRMEQEWLDGDSPLRATE